MAQRPLRQILFLQSVLIAGLPFLLAGVLVVVWLLPQIDRELEDRQLQLARSVAAQVGSYLTTPLQQAGGLALLLQEQPLAAAQLQQVLDAHLEVTPSLQTIYVVNPADRIRVVGLSAAHRERRVDLLGLDLSHNRLLQQARQGAVPVWSDTFLSLLSEGLAVAFAIPVQDQVLIGEVDLRQLSDFLQQIVGGGDRLLLVLDRHGQVIADADGWHTAQQLNISNLPLVARGLAGADRAHGEIRFEGQGYLGSLVRVPTLNWLVLVALPMEKAFQAVGTSLRITLAGLLAALGFALVLAYYLSHRLAGSFEALTQHARHLATAGGPDPATWPQANIREFQELADDLERMSDTLWERERQLFTLMSNLPGMAYRCQVDAERSWVFISEGCRELVGSTEQELLAGPWPGLNALVEETDRAEVRRQIEQRLAQDRPFHLIYRLRSGGGADKWVLDSGRGVHDRLGQLCCIEGLVIDITAERLAEQALQQALAETAEARDRIELILRSVADGLVFTDPQGRVVLMSASAEGLLGIDQQRGCGQKLEALLAEPALQGHFAALRQGEGEPARLELALPGANPGGLRDLEIKSARVPGRDGSTAGVITLLRDVSRERQLDRMKSEFVSTAAHELRTPLAVIMGFSELLLEEPQLSPAQREYLGIIYEKTEVLQRLIDDLLDLGRVESGKTVHVEKGPCDLVELIRQEVADFQLTHENYRFTAELPDAPVELKADALRLGQTLENLLGNAVKFSPAGSLIRIRCRRRAGMVEVSVRDPGVGMTPEQAGRIFEKFYRVDTSATSKQGLGLGMTIVKNIIDAHGGQIRVESRLGEGTEIVFSLPLAGAAPD